MPRASDLKALADLERRIALLRPPPPFQGAGWLKLTLDSELDELEAIYRCAADEGRELSAVDCARALAIKAAVLARSLEGSA